MIPSETEPDFPCQTLTIVGVGLIGGSLAAAARQRGLVQRVIGVGRSTSRLKGAIERGLIDGATDNLAEAAAASDLIVFCTPVDQIAAGVREAARYCRCGTLITDAGSTKQEICENLAGGFPLGVEFIGSHPLAGSEKSGYEFSDANLFANRVCVLTPQAGTSETGLRRLRSFWEGIQARVLEMTPEAHDRAVAETSHFPHLAAAALAATLTPEHVPLAARGFRDTTRIASGDADLWVSILTSNSDKICQSLDKFTGILNRYRVALMQHDTATLRELLDTGKKSRDQLT